MAKVVTVEIEANTDKATSELEDLRKEIEKLNKEVVDSNKKTEKSLDNVESSAKSTQKTLRSIGTTIKAIGIGLLIEALGVVRDLFNSNQKVVDTFNTTFEFLSIIFNDFVRFVTTNFGNVKDAFDSVFKDPLQSLKDLGNAIKQGIIDRFNQALEVTSLLGQSLVKLFKGDFSGAWDTAKKASREFLDVVTGTEDTFEKLEKVSVDVENAIKNYTNKTWKAAKATVQLTKDVEYLTVVNQGLIEEYDKQAEIQRQIRDNETLSIEDRIKANVKLGKILDKQKKEMLDNINEEIRLAKVELAKDETNQKARIALQEALNEKKAIEAQVEGFISEQKINRVALEKEAMEVEQLRIDSANERRLSQLDFEAEMQENELARLERVKGNLDIENELETKRLNDKIKLYKEGTLARTEAEQELTNFQQQNANAQIKIDRDIAKAKMNITKQALGGLAALVGENSKFGKAIAITQAIQDTYAGANKALAQGGIFGFIAAAGIIAGGLANVRNIASTQDPTPPSFASGSIGGSASVPSVSAPQPPAFNIVGASQTSQLADVINSKNNEPIRAYVVTNDVTTGQAMDRNIIDNASI